MSTKNNNTNAQRAHKGRISHWTWGRTQKRHGQGSGLAIKFNDKWDEWLEIDKHFEKPSQICILQKNEYLRDLVQRLSVGQRIGKQAAVKGITRNIATSIDRACHSVRSMWIQVVNRQAEGKSTSRLNTVVCILGCVHCGPSFPKPRRLVLIRFPSPSPSSGPVPARKKAAHFD